MASPSETALPLADQIDSLFIALTSARISSDEYWDKALNIDHCLRELSKLHPNWSEEQQRLLTQQEDNAPALQDRDPFVFVYQHTESLVSAWKEMHVIEPSINSLSTAANAFRIALGNLRAECIYLNNRN